MALGCGAVRWLAVRAPAGGGLYIRDIIFSCLQTSFAAQKPLRMMPIDHPDSKDDPEDGQNGQENGDNDFFVTVWWRHR